MESNEECQSPELTEEECKRYEKLEAELLEEVQLKEADAQAWLLAHEWLLAHDHAHLVKPLND